MIARAVPAVNGRPAPRVVRDDMSLLSDLRFAFRMLRKDRWFTAAAVTALALGLGVNATVFTFVNAVLIRGLPFPEADRLIHIDSQNLVNDRGNLGVSHLDLEDWRRQVTTFEGLGAWSSGTMNVSEPDRLPERLFGARVSANMFRLLRQPLLFGRAFTPEEERPDAPGVAILSHSVWQNRYGSDRGVIGRVIRINAVPATIVGVMPEGMRFPNDIDLWQPLAPGPKDRRDRRGLNVFGRLAPGAVRAPRRTLLRGRGSDRAPHPADGA